MMTWLWGNSLWQLVKQSDAMTLGVLGLLLALSVISWAIVLYKLILLRLKKRQLARASGSLREIDSLDALLQLSASLQGTLPGHVLACLLASLKSVLQRGSEQARESLTYDDLAHLQLAGDCTLDEVMHHEEAYLPFLATTAAAAPLLGLFGTVWGLVHAFIRMSEKQVADISAVAPGIAEALITTLAGLMVAIPALMFFHYLKSQTRHIEHEMSVLMDRFGALVHQLFVR